MLFHNIIKKLVSYLCNSQRIRRTSSLVIDSRAISRASVRSRAKMPRQNQKPLQEPESNKSLDAARVISSPSQCLRSQKPSAVKAKCSQPSISLSQVIEPLTRAKTIAKQKISEPSFSVSLDYLISETKSGFPVFSKRPNEKPITKQQPLVNFPTEVLL